MTANQIAALVDAGIPFLSGIYITLLAHRVVGKKPGESATYDEWHQKRGKQLKIFGPLMIAFGIFLAIDHLG